ncbi:uncharacterized protein [Aristolochia californica]|uniref:uncharacterized protein n=1 Tax=Aristolochia californica TaxID=171875 RepID=UPI0035D84B82
MRAQTGFSDVEESSNEFLLPPRGPGGSSQAAGEANEQSRRPAIKNPHLEQCGKRINLSLQIPKRPMGFANNGNVKVPVHSQGPLSSSSLRGISQVHSFKNASPVINERSSLLNPDDCLIPESASLATYIRALSWKRSSSLPVTPASTFSPAISASDSTRTCRGQLPEHRHQVQKRVSRSLSVPSRNIVILRSTSLTIRKELSQTDQTDPDNVDDEDEEIPEEEAICRVCLDGLYDGGLKMQCSCKGALQLIHEQCAVKWFSIKGNKICDVCGQEVLNLPVTLFRMQSTLQRDNNRQLPTIQNSNAELTRAWQDVVVLFFISTMCYFFFVEQLLVDDMKSNAVKIALTSSFILASLASILSIILARRDYIWAYSAFQFALVTISLHIFYVRLHLSAVNALLMAAAAGFSIAFIINSLCFFTFGWRSEMFDARFDSNPV